MRDSTTVQTVPLPGYGAIEPGGVEWLFNLERRAILPVKWLMGLLCAALVFVRAPEYLPALSEFALLVFYLLSNVVFSYLFYFKRVGPNQLRPLSIVSFAFDVFVMASFIYLTGGIDSDFFILFFLVILRGMGFFPTARMNVLANVVVGLIYISTLVLAGFDSHIMHEQEFYEKVLLVVGVVLLSWFLIEIQAQQNRNLLATNNRLLFERAYVRNLLESMTDGVVAFSPQMEVTTINAAARQILNLPDGEWDPRGIKERIPEVLIRAGRKLAQTGKETTDETLTARLPGGGTKVLRLSIRALSRPDEESAGVVAIFEDLSTLQRIEEQLWQSEKLASVGQLAAGVAHELGNPIGIIKSCAEYMNGQIAKKPLPEPFQQSLAEEVGVIASESARCQRILRELLSYSSQEELALRDIDLNEAVRRAEGLVAYNVPEERIGLEAELAPESLHAKADENLLTQALVNIFLNAIEAIDERGRVIARTCKETASDGAILHVGVEIEDTGRGMAPETRRRIFEPFFTTRDEGTGLGLAITHRIVERLGGRIEVESEEGRGSRFRIWLQPAG